MEILRTFWIWLTTNHLFVLIKNVRNCVWRVRETSWHQAVWISIEAHHQATPGSPFSAGCCSVLMSYHLGTWGHLHWSCSWLRSSSSAELTAKQKWYKHDYLGYLVMGFAKRVKILRNTDWFAFIRTQRWVLVVRPRQCRKILIVNREILGLFSWRLCDHPNCDVNIKKKKKRQQ